MWEPLLQNVTKKGIQLTEEETEILCSSFTHKKLRKNQYILQQGDVARHESFVLRGLTRTYLVDDRGQEHILAFAPEDWWIGDLNSHHNERPTAFNIDCLEETEVLQITKAAMEDLCTRVPKMNLFYRKLYCNSIIAYNNRIASTLSLSAAERYEEFRERYPQIEQRVPNHQIASYLGITPQSLSRLRRKLAEK